MFFAALQNYTFQLSQLANLQSAVFFQSKVVFSFLSFHYFRQHVNINIKTGALKLSLLGIWYRIMIWWNTRRICNETILAHLWHVWQGNGLLFHEYKSAFTICSENIRSPNQSVAPMIFYIWFQYLNCVIQCFIQRTNDQLLRWYLTFDSMFELWHLIKCSGGILHSIQKLELCHPMYYSQNQQLLTMMIEQGQQTNRNW